MIYSLAIAELEVLQQDAPDVSALRRSGEFYAGGFYELPEASLQRRWSRALRRYFEGRPMMQYAGGALHPSGGCSLWNADRQQLLLEPNHSYTWGYAAQYLDKALQGCRDDDSRQAVQRLHKQFTVLERVPRWMRPPHTVAGNGWTHSVPDYCRVSREGLEGIEQRVQRRLAEATERGDAAREDFYLGLLDLLAGVRVWLARMVDFLSSCPASDASASARRDRLVAALRRVPLQPAPRAAGESRTSCGRTSTWAACRCRSALPTRPRFATRWRTRSVTETWRCAWAGSRRGSSRCRETCRRSSCSGPSTADRGSTRCAVGAACTAGPGRLCSRRTLVLIAEGSTL